MRILHIRLSLKKLALSYCNLSLSYALVRRVKLKYSYPLKLLFFGLYGVVYPTAYNKCVASTAKVEESEKARKSTVSRVMLKEQNILSVTWELLKLGKEIQYIIWLGNG